MASKWSDLPDIDTAPDVYETEEVASSTAAAAAPEPSPSISTSASASASDDIEGLATLRIKPGRAARAFRTARFDGSYADFSGALRPRAPSAAQPVRSGSKAHTAGETRAETLIRLRVQLDDLSQQGGPDDEQSEHLAALYAVLEREEKRHAASMARRQVRSTLGPTTAPSPDPAWTHRTRDLLSAASNNLSAPSPPPPSSSSASPESSEAAPPTVPEVRTSHVETKLTALEKFTGTTAGASGGLHGLGPDPGAGLSTAAGLLPTVQKIEQNLVLLSQPKHRDAVARRIKVLATELDRVQDLTRRSTPAAETNLLTSATTATTTVGGSGTPALPSDSLDPSASPIPRLWRVQAALEPIWPVADTLVGRMRTLAALHDQAQEFAPRLALLSNQADSLTQAQQVTGTTLFNLEEQVTGLSSQMDALVQLNHRLSDLSDQLTQIFPTVPLTKQHDPPDGVLEPGDEIVYE